MHPLFRKADELSHLAIGAAIEVHRLKGPGLIESTYERCLMRCCWNLTEENEANEGASPVYMWLYKSEAKKAGQSGRVKNCVLRPWAFPHPPPALQFVLQSSMVAVSWALQKSILTSDGQL
jgi:hypothetical protein